MCFSRTRARKQPVTAQPAIFVLRDHSVSSNLTSTRKEDVPRFQTMSLKPRHSFGAYLWHVFVVDPVPPKMRRIHHAHAVGEVIVFVKLASEWTRLQKPMRFHGQLSESCFFPTLRYGADFGLFLRFAAEAFGEEFVQKRLFQFGGQRDQPLLLLDRPLHQPQHGRNFPLLREGWHWDD